MKCCVAELAIFDYKMQYRPGCTNGNGDAVSRHQVEDMTEVGSARQRISVPDNGQQAATMDPRSTF